MKKHLPWLTLIKQVYWLSKLFKIALKHRKHPGRLFVQARSTKLAERVLQT